MGERLLPVAPQVSSFKFASLSPYAPSMFICPQVRVRAEDGDSPPRTSTEVVTVTVNRNLHLPTFTRPSEDVGFAAEVEIKETDSFEKVIYTLDAKDDDQRVSTRGQRAGRQSI